MRRTLIILTLFLIGNHSVTAQEPTGEQAIYDYLGTDDPSELDSDEIERLERLLDAPVRINMCDDVELRTCGLFSAYQIAVLEDYISTHGTIRSFIELSLLDGFGEIFVRRILPFVSLLSESKTNQRSSTETRHELVSRGGLSLREGERLDGSYGIKYRLTGKEDMSAVLAASGSSVSESWIPSAFSGSISWRSRKVPFRMITGDFNARFGQGLVLWNGSFINSLTSPDSFMKKPSGLAQPWSFTGNTALSGVAMDYRLGKFLVSAVAAFPGLKTVLLKPDAVQFMPAFNVSWFCRAGQVSFTNVTAVPTGVGNAEVLQKTGVDAAFCVRGVNFFGEIAYDWLENVPSVIAGTRFKAGEALDMAVQARSLQDERSGAAVGVSFTSGNRFTGTFVADAEYYHVPKDKDDRHSLRLKCLLAMETVFSGGWKMRLRVSERIRTWGLPFRTDIRTDLIYSSGTFMAALRANVLTCDRAGYLSYLEGGYIAGRFSAYLRQGVFCIDDWDDRIYVYERDAPGSFNVPAMYGRGVWTSLTSQFKFSSSLRFHARASLLAYPFMQKKKPGKAELKLQLQYRF